MSAYASYIAHKETARALVNPVDRALSRRRAAFYAKLVRAIRRRHRALARIVEN